MFAASIHRLKTLIVKELLSYLRDPRTRMILLGPPLMQLLIFSFALTLEVKNVDIAVLNNDSGTLGTELVQAVSAAQFTDEITIAYHAGTLERLIDEGKVLLAVNIPAEFSRKTLRDGSGSVQILLDGRRANAAQLASGYLNTITREVGARSAAMSTGDATPFPGIQLRHWYNPNLSYRWFIVPSLSGVLALLISLLVTALSIARERELGTFDQLLVSPISPTEIIIGKSIPALMIGAALGTIMILAGVLLFRIPFTGSVTMLAMALPVFILSGVGIGLSISAVCQTQQQAILGAFALIVPIVLTSGFATPVSNMPGWLQTVSLANPLRHYLIIAQGSFLKAMPATQVLANTWPLLLIAAGTLSFAVWLVRRRLQ
ncbi:MAG: ABC transporter permease [Granulosicoccus sp.]|nr:ABC transporter permease [Granulosicoccus sp.]